MLPGAAATRPRADGLHRARGDASDACDANCTDRPVPARPNPAAGTGPLIIDVAKALADRRNGIVASTGGPLSAEPPAAVQAAPASPRVAIFVGGMGLSSTATRTATELMPSAVSFAFVPYGETVAAAVAAAKARGHEILLQVPMQNAGAPAPGPHALRPGEPDAEVAADATWLMGRFDGYDGMVNLLGAPVTADRP